MPNAHTTHKNPEPLFIPSTLPREPASRGRVENSEPPAGLPAGGSSASLDPLETNDHTLLIQTRYQQGVHGRWNLQRKTIYDALSTSNDPNTRRRANALRDCCQIAWITLDEEGRPNVRGSRCRHRLCPLCSSCRQRLASSRLTQALQQAASARLITLTIQHSNDPLDHQIKRLGDSFRKLRKHKEFKKHVRGGAFTLEVTYNVSRGEWHPHLHVIAEGEYFPHGRLSAAWLAVTGDSQIVDIRPIHDRAIAAKYLTKYAVKPTAIEAWPPYAICEFTETMHGKRAIATFGTWRRIELVRAHDDDHPNTERRCLNVESLNTCARDGYPRAVRAVVVLHRLYANMSQAAGIHRTTVGEAAFPSTPRDAENLRQDLIYLTHCHNEARVPDAPAEETPNTRLRPREQQREIFRPTYDGRLSLAPPD